MVWCGVAWRGVAWRYVALCGVVWRAVVWRGRGVSVVGMGLGVMVVMRWMGLEYDFTGRKGGTFASPCIFAFEVHEMITI